MAKKTSSKLKSHEAKKAWKMLREGCSYKAIGDILNVTTTAIKLYANRKFKKEADKLWSAEIRKVGKCEIPGCNGDDLNAHHLLEKSVYPHLRHDLSNGVCLCSNHHTFSNEISPHGCLAATEAFLDWLQDERRGQWAWYQENKTRKSLDTDYETAYNLLKGE